MAPILGGQITHVLLAIYCHEEHNERVNIGHLINSKVCNEGGSPIVDTSFKNTKYANFNFFSLIIFTVYVVVNWKILILPRGHLTLSDVTFFLIQKQEITDSLYPQAYCCSYELSLLNPFS
jgi:hypothetical protein